MNTKIGLRRIEREDISLLWKWSRSEELAFFNAFTSNKSKAEFEKEYESGIGNNTLKDYVILQGDDEIPTGFCGIKDISWVDRHGELFISICDESARKSGTATIAVLMLMKIAFYELNLNKVYVKIAAHNARMMNMMGDWGLVNEGVLREMHYHNNRYYDVHVFGLLRSEANKMIRTAIGKIAKHLFPGCTNEIIDQIKAALDTITDNQSSPGSVLVTSGL